MPANLWNERSVALEGAGEEEASIVGCLCTPLDRLADKAFLVPYVEEQGMVFIGGDVPLGDGIGMGVRESDSSLKDTFDTAITSMKEDGSLNALIEKWLPGSETF